MPEWPMLQLPDKKGKLILKVIYTSRGSHQKSAPNLRHSFTSHLYIFTFWERTSLVCLFVVYMKKQFFASKLAAISLKVAVLCFAMVFPESCFSRDCHHDTKGFLASKIQKGI